MNPTDPVSVLAKASRDEVGVMRVTQDLGPNKRQLGRALNKRAGYSPLAAMPDFAPANWGIVGRGLTLLSRMLVPICMCLASLRAPNRASALSLEDMALVGSCPKPWLHLYRPQSGWAHLPFGL